MSNRNWSETAFYGYTILTSEQRELTNYDNNHSVLFIWDLFQYYALSIHRNGYSSDGIGMGYGLHGRGSIHHRGKIYFSTSLPPERLWWPPSLLTNGRKRLWSEADYLPPTIVKNARPVVPLLLTSSWSGASLIKSKSNVTSAMH